METFLLFAFFFGLFAWGMRRLLKLTRDTVGDNSPLKVSRVYAISKTRYFTGFDGILAAFMAITGLVVFFQLARIPPPIDRNFYYPAIFFAPLLMLGVSALMFSLLLNHWPYVRDIVIEANPADRSLDIKLSNRHFTIREGDIVKIEEIYSKFRHGHPSYTSYHVANGEDFILSTWMPGQEVFREYFPKSPFSISYGKFGFIEK